MQKIIIGNWKMNPATQKEAVELFDAIKNGLGEIKNAEVVICPPFSYILNFKCTSGDALRVKKISNLFLGAQNTTDEFSVETLKNMGVEYVILGHSDVRKLGETNQATNKKIQEVLVAGLKVILCVGEQDGENKETVLMKQLTEGLAEIINHKSYILNLVVAYEPVWAIGTGNNCTIEETQASVLLIKKILEKIFGETANQIKILYGGSVNAKNSADYLKNGGVDGLLVGGASLDARDFVKIVESV